MLYPFVQKGDVRMDSYDNDILLLLLDDDLFWVEEDVGILSTESGED